MPMLKMYHYAKPGNTVLKDRFIPAKYLQKEN